MTDWVMLLRGINVGGTGRLAMADLRALVQKLGGRAVKTYIQSGNLVFSGLVDAKAFEQIVAGEIEAAHGFRPRVLLLAAEDFREIVAGYPWPEALEAPKTGHIWFTAGPSATDPERFAALAAKTERTALAEHALYLHAPEGIGRSPLAARAERLLGVAATARNLATCMKLVDMLDKSAP